MEMVSRHALSRRRSPRLLGYDYRRAGAYFLTLVSRGRRCLFGTVIEGEIQLGPVGMMVARCWQDIPQHFSNAVLDYWIVMPNHVHGIVLLAPPATGHAPTERDRRSGSIGAIVGAVKSASTRLINATRNRHSETIWQRGYYDHVIRSEKSLQQIRRYIEGNPGRWAEDPENPANVRT